MNTSFHLGCLLFILICLGNGFAGKPDGYRLIIDTDCGPDDAMAIILLLSKGKYIDIEGITTVSGNTGVVNATRNVLLTLQTQNRLDIPVYMGSVDPLLQPASYDGYFGYDGFGDYPYPNVNSTSLSDIQASVFLSQLVKDNPGQITILAIGPLTNIALAAHLYPRFLTEVKSMFILGGNYKGRGNVNPGVEFNIYFDPEAARYVFLNSPKHLITLVPFETAKENYFPMAFRKEVLGDLKSNSMELLNKAERLALNGTEWLCFDQIAASLLLDDKICTSSLMSQPLIEVEGKLARGVMLHDFNKESVKIVTSINKTQLESLLLEALS